MFTAALFTIAKKWKQPAHMCISERIAKRNVVCTSAVLFSLKNRGNADTGYNMRERGRYCAKINKPATERHVLRFHLYAVSTVGRFTETESRAVVDRTEGEGERRRCCFIGTEFQICKTKTFWGSVSR